MAKLDSEACAINLDQMLDAREKYKNVDPEKADKIMESFVEQALEGKKPNLGMKINEYLINGMLSGTGTPVVNTLGGGIQTIMKPLLNLIDAYVPKSGRTALQAQRDKRAAKATVSALFDGWTTDMVFFSRGFGTGMPVDFKITPRSLGMSEKQFNQWLVDAGAAPDINGYVNPELARKALGESYDYMTNAIGGKTGDIVRLPTKITVAIDEYFKARLRSQRMMGYLSKKASLDEEKGLGSYDTLYKKYKEQTFNGGKAEELYGSMDRFEQMVGADFDTAIYDVRNYAIDGTFQAKLTGMLKKISEAKGEGRTPAEVFLTQTIPFLRTPWNIFKESSGYIPGVGFVVRPTKTVTTKRVRQASDGTEVVDFITANENLSMREMIPRQLVGFAITGGVYQLFDNDLITGSMPTDPAERNTWKSLGKPATSIKVGDTWIDYSRSEPLATVLGMMTDLFSEQKRIMNGEVQAGKEWEDIQEKAWSSVKTNMLQKTFMQGFADLTSALFANNTTMAEGLLDNYAKRFIPALSNTAARTFDPNEREAISTIEKMQQRIPGARNLLPKNYGLVNEDPNNPVPQALETNLSQAISGVAVSREQTEFQKRLSDIGFSVSSVSRKVGGKELTAEQYSEYKRLINELATPVLSGALPTLEKIGNKKTAEYAIEKRIMPRIKRAALGRLRQKYPELTEAIREDKLFDRVGNQ